MSINIGQGFLTASLDMQKLHDIRDSSTVPEMSLWGKIKDFFFSTRQEEAFTCVHRLYHHDKYQMSGTDLRDTFIQLRTLAAPGCRNKFVIDRSGFEDIYKIDGETILSRPVQDNRFISKENNDHWYDCQDEEDTWFDCDNEASNNELLQQQSPADTWSYADQYIHSTHSFLSMLATEFQDIKKVEIVRRVGLANIVSVTRSGAVILRQLSAPEPDHKIIKREITKFTHIPKLVEMLPEYIKNTSDYVFLTQ